MSRKVEIKNKLVKERKKLKRRRERKKEIVIAKEMYMEKDNS